MAMDGGRREVGGSSKKFTEDEMRTVKGMRPLRIGGPSKLRQVASGSAMQSLYP